MKSIRVRRLSALAILAFLSAVPQRVQASPMSDCFAACYVMEVGCNTLGGVLVASCTFNSGAAPDSQCRLPGCVCPQKIDGNCAGDDLPLMAD